MDIFAHTLWAAAAAKGANKNKKIVEKNKRPLRAGWAAFWGVAPDLFAFGLPLLALFYFLIIGEVDISNFASHHFNALPESASWISTLPSFLYQISHSLVIFSAVFLIIWAIRRRPYYEMLGWALHILIDIPSHAANFYPTPFLWPVSDFKFLYGISWGNHWYMIINYSCLLAVYTYFFWKSKKGKAL